MFPMPAPRREATSLDEPIVWQEITRLARAALRDAAESDTAGLPVRGRLSDSSGHGWDIRAQPLLQAVHGQPVVVVAIERARGGELSSEIEEVRERFGISPRQAEVALLLAQRLTDKEIAARLGISRHTARRHAELVMIRMRVHSRAELGELLGTTQVLPRVSGE